MKCFISLDGLFLLSLQCFKYMILIVNLIKVRCQLQYFATSLKVYNALSSLITPQRYTLLGLF